MKENIPEKSSQRKLLDNSFLLTKVHAEYITIHLTFSSSMLNTEQEYKQQAKDRDIRQAPIRLKTAIGNGHSTVHKFLTNSQI